MSARPNRRAMLMVGTGLGALMLGAGGYEAWRLFGRHYPPTPYDDLLSQLTDREAARKIGSAYSASHPEFSARSAAHLLRSRIRANDLRPALLTEIADNSVIEAGHWVMPESLVLLCAIAAKT